MDKHTPGPWTDNADGPYPFYCGCVVTREYRSFRGRDQRRGVIDYCAKHAAAPRMLDLIEERLSAVWIDGGECPECGVRVEDDTSDECRNPECWVPQARAILEGAS